MTRWHSSLLALCLNCVCIRILEFLASSLLDEYFLLQRPCSQNTEGNDRRERCRIRSAFFPAQVQPGKIDFTVQPRGNALLLGESQMSAFSYSRCIHCQEQEIIFSTNKYLEGCQTTAPNKGNPKWHHLSTPLLLFIFWKVPHHTKFISRKLLTMSS